jgi:hypothetical protein
MPKFLLLLPLLALPYLTLGQTKINEDTNPPELGSSAEEIQKYYQRIVTKGFVIIVAYTGPLPGTMDDIRKRYPPPLWPSQKIKWGHEWDDYKTFYSSQAIFAVKAENSDRKDYGLYLIDDQRLHKVADITQKSGFERFFWGPLKKYGLSLIAEVVTHHAAEAIPLP